MVEEPALLTEENGSILTVTFNRPQKLNALNQDLLARLDQAIIAFRDRPELRVLLIRGRGRYFTAGADLSGAGGPDFGNSPMAVRNWYRTQMNGMQRMWDELEAIEKPIVAAHHAPCFGGGLELSLSCDFRLAATSARYAFPEANFGMIPASGGVSRLTRIVGPHWARWLILANKPITAEQALAMGLVHQVIPDDEFDAEVTAFCQHLAAQPPEVSAIAKRAIELSTDLDAAQARHVERLAASLLTGGKEYEELLAKVVRRHSGGERP